MRIGAMDTQVLIEQPTYSTSTSGQKIPTWSTLVTVWAEQVEKNAGENYEANQLVASKQKLFKIRHYSGITEKMRINLDGEYYYINGIARDGRQRFLLLTAEKKDNG